MLGLVFREIELVGAERLPATGPVMVIANHYNSLVDGGVLLAFLPRIPRFLAASTVWDYKPVAPFMNASGSVKVFRQQDGRAHEGSLEDSFTDAAALLVAGGVLAIFPEGRSHDDPTLLPFKTGTARIAAFTQDRHGPLDLAVVPVGLDYEVKNLFRTRVCFSFAEPVRIGATAGAGGAEPGRQSETVRKATGALKQALGAVAPDFASREEARELTLAGEILALEPGPTAGQAPAFSRIVTARRTVRAALDRAEAAGDGQRARSALKAYADALAAAGLTDPELAARPGRAALARSALALLAGLPVALVALAFSLPQALVLRRVSRRKDRDKQMTWMLFGGLVLFALTWILWALVLGLVAAAGWGGGWGWAVAAGTLVAAPLSVWLAMPTIDRALRLGRAVRARRILGRDPGLGDRLMGLRARARIALDAVLDPVPPNRSG